MSAFTSSALNLAIERLFVRQPNSRITPAASVLTSTLCVVSTYCAPRCPVTKHRRFAGSVAIALSAFSCFAAAMRAAAMATAWREGL